MEKIMATEEIVIEQDALEGLLEDIQPSRFLQVRTDAEMVADLERLMKYYNVGSKSKMVRALISTAANSLRSEE